MKLKNGIQQFKKKFNQEQQKSGPKLTFFRGVMLIILISSFSLYFFLKTKKASTVRITDQLTSEQFSYSKTSIDEDFIVDLLEKKALSKPNKTKLIKKIKKEIQEKIPIKRNYRISSYSPSKHKSTTIVVDSGEKIKATLSFGITSSTTQPISAILITDKKDLKSALVFGSIRSFEGDRIALSFSILQLSTGEKIPISSYALGLDTEIGVKANIQKISANTSVLKSIKSSLSFNSIADTIGEAAIDAYVPDPKKPTGTLKKGTSFFLYFSEAVVIKGER